MDWLWWILGVAFGLVLLYLVVVLVCFFKVFYSPRRKPLGEDEYDIPEGEIYEPFREGMIFWIKKYREYPHEDVCITSRDGLKLVGRYYEYEKGAPLEILFHGYKGNGERDLSGGVERCFLLGRNALIVDQRSSGRSEGRVITFGIKERLDCLDWLNYCAARFGEDTKIIITGVSMGAATVIMAAAEDLPKQVVCALGDCGYTSAKEIIKKVITEMHLPAGLAYPFVRLGARIFGGFDLEETSPIEAVREAKIPIIFIHGDTDDFVPCYMSERMYEECVSPKALKIIHGAGHGLAFPIDKEGYLSALRDFQTQLL